MNPVLWAFFIFSIPIMDRLVQERMGSIMKRFFMVLLFIFFLAMGTSCGDDVPQAELDYKGGTEDIIVEDIIVEEVVTWDNVPQQTWD